MGQGRKGMPRLFPLTVPLGEFVRLAHFDPALSNAISWGELRFQLGTAPSPWIRTPLAGTASTVAGLGRHQAGAVPWIPILMHSAQKLADRKTSTQGSKLPTDIVATTAPPTRAER